MDPDTFVETLEADHETELSRLASSKVLYALTDGEMSAAAVFDALLTRASAAAETVTDWSSAAIDDVAQSFEAAAATLRADIDAIDAAAADAGVAVGSAPEATSDPLVDRLNSHTAPVERAAGLVAWTLVEDGTRRQAVGFFVGNADPATAERFRERRTAIADVRDDALDLLGSVCADDADWDRAVAAGGATIEAAYAHYVTRLEAMGVTVKPVC